VNLLTILILEENKDGVVGYFVKMNSNISGIV